jgi:hypothetical protein
MNRAFRVSLAAMTRPSRYAPNNEALMPNQFHAPGFVSALTCEP